MQGPERYLEELGVRLACAVDPERDARVDAEHRIFVNYETYYVSSAEARGAFLREPYRYTGALTDPVTRARFVPDATSPRVDYDGRPYYFASPDTRDRFVANPAAHATPRLAPRPSPS